MNFLSKKLTEYILEKGIIEKYNYEIYQYGFQIFLELSLNILCSIIIAVILDMKIECIFFFLFLFPCVLTMADSIWIVIYHVFCCHVQLWHSHY